MAEALLRKHAGDRFEVHSAGTEPKEIHPLTRQVMAEIGLNLEGQYAKGMEKYVGKLPIRYLIIVCDQAKGTCPAVWPYAAEQLFWRFEDPAEAKGTEEERLAKFRSVRNQIDARIKEWLAGEE